MGCYLEMLNWRLSSGTPAPFGVLTQPSWLPCYNSGMGTPPTSAQRSKLRRTRAIPPEPEAAWMTTGDVARELLVGRKLVLDWIHSGELPAVNLSANADSPSRTGWRVSREALNEFLAHRGAGFVDIDGRAQRH